MNPKKSIDKGRRRFHPKTNGYHHAAFRGGISELSGHYYDFSDYTDSDRFIATIRNIKDHIGRTYTNSGDVRRYLDDGVVCSIPMPPDPEDKYTDIVDKNNIIIKTARQKISHAEEVIFNQKISLYVKREQILESNLQKAYSLVYGQCTEVVKNKLKSVGSWESIERNLNVLQLLAEIRKLC